MADDNISMLTEYHCHLLPHMDDGAESVETACMMLGRLKEQGVGRIVATPHFYAHREKSVDSFLSRRAASAEALGDTGCELRLGAEVAIERGISDLCGIEKLAIQGTSLILLELPYTRFAPWMAEEIYNIASGCRLTPIIAHIHRYIDYCSAPQLEALIQSDAILQLNNEAFENRHERSLATRLIKNDFRVVFGSDCHGIKTRSPNFDILLKRMKSKPEVIERSNEILDAYAR